MTGTPITGSYLSLEDAETIIDDRLGTDIWDAASNADKTKALKMATKTIDSLNYQGVTIVEDQARQFPRMYRPNPFEDSPWGIVTLNQSLNGYIYVSTDVPTEALAACALEAMAILDSYNNDGGLDEADLISKGVKSITMGKMSMSFGKANAAGRGFKSMEAYRLISPLMEFATYIQ